MHETYILAMRFIFSAHRPSYVHIKRHKSYAFQRYLSLGLLALMDLHRIPLDLHVCPASPVSISSHLERSASFPANHFVYPQSISSFFLTCTLRVDSGLSQLCLAGRGIRCSPLVGCMILNFLLRAMFCIVLVEQQSIRFLFQ